LTLSEGAELGLVTKLSNTPAYDAMAMAREFADRSPDAMRGAKRIINRPSTAGAADHFAVECEIILRLNSSANHV